MTQKAQHLEIFKKSLQAACDQMNKNKEKDFSWTLVVDVTAGGEPFKCWPRNESEPERPDAIARVMKRDGVWSYEIVRPNLLEGVME